MTRRAIIMLLSAVAVMLILASTAWAASTTAIIQDASDGIVDGHYSASAVRAALRVVRADPVYSQYSDIEGVIADYLARLGGGGGGGATSVGSTRSTANDSSEPGTGSGGSAKPGQTPKPKHTPTAGPSSASPGGEATDVTPPSSGSLEQLPTVGAWEQVKVRLAAVPWFFAVVAVALVAGCVALVRRSV